MIFSRQPNRAAFTLIELVISAALMTLVLGSAYMCLSAGVAGGKMVETRGEAVQSARTALDLIAADLREAIPMFSTNGLPEFIGATSAESGVEYLDFATRHYTPHRKYEADSCMVSYFLEADLESDAYILKRRRKAILDRNPLDGGATEEIARGVRDMYFRYFDRYGDPWDDWGDVEKKTKGMLLPPENSAGLPFAVRVTLVMNAEGSKKRREKTDANADAEPETKATLKFQTVAHPRLAEFFYQQAYANSESGGEQTAQPQAAPEGGAQ
jgi:type II secretory pathway component PulJ